MINCNDRITYCKIKNLFVKKYIGNSKFINTIFNQEVIINSYLKYKKLDIMPKIKAIYRHKDFKKIYFEKIDGISFEKYLKKEKDFIKKLKIYLKILDAVSNLHNLNIVHNDININNIMISKNEKIYIIDFSEAKFLNINSGQVKKYISYNLAYSSIEQYSKYNRNFIENDTYSLTAVFYYIIFKKECKPIYLQYEPIVHKNNEIKDFLNKGLSFNKKNRYKNILTMKQKIEALIEKI